MFKKLPIDEQRRRIQKVALKASIGALILINIVEALPTTHKANWEPVGEDWVRVDASGDHTVPITQMDINSGSFIDTGKRVEVFVRPWYKEEAQLWYWRVSLGILIVIGILAYL